MKQIKIRLMNLEAITGSNNQEPNFYFIEDPSQEEKPHYTGTLELAGWAIFSCEGENIESFQNRVKAAYKAEMKARKIKLPRYVVFFGKNPEIIQNER